MYSVLKYTAIASVAAGMLSFISVNSREELKALEKVSRTGINNTRVLLADTPPPAGGGDTNKIVLPYP
ncbi:MAG: hypothetical protein ACJ76F_12295, partial [Bacteroidia bacterium]